jgi:hypothetical protein
VKTLDSPRRKYYYTFFDAAGRNIWRRRLRGNLEGSGDMDDENRSYRDRFLEAQRVIEQQRAENARQRAESERHRAESERHRMESAEHAALSNGTYYATIDQVWVGEEAEYGHARHFTALVRSAPPTFIPRSKAVAGGDESDDDDAPNRGDPRNSTKNKRAVYARTKECAEDGEMYEAAAAATNTESSRGRSSRSSSRSLSGKEDKLAIWPTDIFGNDPSDDTQIAHLVPASYNVATLYRDVAIWTLGLHKDAGWETTQMAIHGAKKKNVDGNANETGDNGTAPNATARSTRKVIRTGIKHFVPNRIRLANQAPFLDNAPCVLIVPVLTLTEVKRWNGEEYKAIVMVEKWKRNSAKAICRAIGMLEKKEPFATPGDVAKARSLLEHVVKGMAYSLLKRFPHTFTDNLNDTQKTKFDKLRNAFINLRGRGVVVPKGADALPQRVRMVEFASSSSATGHPAPDPLLLAVRAAVNWSARRNQRLMAAAEPKDDDEDDELDRQAEEEFLAWREEEQEREEQAWRSPSEAELARRLGQPDGYQGDICDDVGARPSPGTRRISPPEAPRPAKRWMRERGARGQDAAT